VNFVVRLRRSFFEGFGVGVTHEEEIALFLVILPHQIHGNTFDFVVFDGALGEVVTKVAFNSS
jgi:hypothetical protein